MTTEFWARNPHNYIREVVQSGVTNVAFSKGLLTKKRTDAQLYCSMFFPGNFRCLSVGLTTVETTRSHPTWNPKAIYPTWRYGYESIDQLEEWCANDFKKGIEGQERRVVISYLPKSGGGQVNPKTKKFLIMLAEIQDDYPKAIIHIHNTYSHSQIFNLGIKSADFEVRTRAYQSIILSSGKRIKYQHANQYRKWLSVIDAPVALADTPKGRCVINLRSLKWAGENWDTSTLPNTNKRTPNMTDDDLERVLNGGKLAPRPHAKGGPKAKGLPEDKLACDYCSLARQCSLYRVGSVCTVPKSPGFELAEHFSTRDSVSIIQGLGKILAVDAERLEQGRDAERELNALDSEVSRISKDLFAKGVQLAKLVDPALRNGPGIIVQQNNGNSPAPAIDNGNPTPQMAVSQAVELLEQNGIPRDAITQSMIQLVSGGEYKKALDEYRKSLPVLEAYEADEFVAVDDF